MKKLIDTNIIILLLLKGLYNTTDQEKDKLEEFFKIKSTDRVIPVHVLTETEVTLNRSIVKKYNIDNKQIKLDLVKRFKLFLAKRNSYYTVYDINDQDFDLAVKIYNESEPSMLIKNMLSMNDILLMAIAKNNNCDIITLDKAIQLFKDKLFI